MTMGVGEAIAVQRVAAWLTGLTSVEHRQVDADALPGEEHRDLVGALTLLADAARKRLGAGPSGVEVRDSLRALLDVKPSPAEGVPDARHSGPS